MRDLRQILVAVNPCAASNSGRRLWNELTPRFRALFSDYEYRIVETTTCEDGTELGATSDAGIIIAVGGDGTVHSIAQGIMQRPRKERPALTMIPIGSGNDFARTLGIPFNPKRALAMLAEGTQAAIDVGRCNGTFFLETLSFGVDAAVALKTVELRKGARDRGLLLYARAAVSSILKELRSHRFSLAIDNDTTLEQNLLICAIQNGPTYGGGFRIAPSAHANDGLFNICMATDINTLKALYALLLIMRGGHEHLSCIQTLTARQLTIDLDQEIPVQCDGEPVWGTHFDIELLPDALDVLMPQGVPL
ncbi:MAG: diacylglycerol kinase family lipid kinase [Coriobacteriales bacterium]|jgi:YegS/Rv2252/BmrU family lipid kinase|nr:diacylglycerol kinase family lipid kinase [Coriobacteriales bacterium]